MKKLFLSIFFLKFCIVFEEYSAEDILQKAEYHCKKKNYEEAIEYYKDALQEIDNVDKIIETKIKIADCYFDNKDYDSSAECYKIILGQFYSFEQKEYVLYKLCLSTYQICPKSSEIDLTSIETLLKYIKFYKNNFSNGDYLIEILNIENKVKDLIVFDDFSNIKFYFDNKLYSSAIFCCDWFLKKYENSKVNLAEVFLYKIKSNYEICKQYVKILKKNDFLKYDFFQKLRQNLILIQECMNNDKIYNYNKEIFDDLYEKCYLLLRKELCKTKK